jgi:hypothetical protein
MKLPQCDRAIVSAEKLRHYLLSSRHPVGAHKAAFFATLGFRRSDWRELRRALTLIASLHDVSSSAATLYGHKHAVRGILHGRNGRSAMVVTVWIVVRGDDLPRFVTAYPEEG